MKFLTRLVRAATFERCHWNQLQVLESSAMLANLNTEEAMYRSSNLLLGFTSGEYRYWDYSKGLSCNGPIVGFVSIYDIRIVED